MTIESNPFSPEFAQDPYAIYARLRDEAPVLQVQGFWAVSRYDDVSHVLKTPEVFSSAGMAGGAAGAPGFNARIIINTDPPDHTYLRNLVNRAFTPKMVAALEPRIREIAREYIGRVAASGAMDIVEDLAVPLPVTVIAEILGVPAERREDFKRWSNAFVGGGAPGQMMSPAVAADREEFGRYFEQVVEERRATPGDDLLSVLVAADEREGGRITGDEIVAFAMLLLIAGNETTTNLIGNAMKALGAHPDQLAAVAADPAMIPNMVEEALRWDSPVQFLLRTATRDTEVGGQRIAGGSVVVPIFASANRDSAKYPDGDTFDITRNTQGHLAFGLGPHFCLGAPLARLEARVAFEELFAHCDGITLAAEGERIGSAFLRGMKSLPISFTPA